MALNDRGGLMAITTDGRDGIRRARIALIGTGVLLIALGAVVMMQTVPPTGIAGVLIWLAGSLVLHDAIIAPIVFGVSVALRKIGKRIPVAVLAIVQGAIGIAAIFAVIVLPAIFAKHLGARNATVLPFDYGLRLAVLYGAIAVIAAILIAVYLMRTRRAKTRPPVDHD
jgi:hypothetical protein